MFFFCFQLSVIAIVFACDKTVNEAKNLKHICYKLQEEYDEETEEESELMAFAEQSEHFVRHFYAAGFLKVDKQAIFGLLGTAMTYFIVIVQFNESEYRHAN